MEFWRYYRVIRRRRWLIILGTLAAVLAVASWNYKSEPTYVGRTTLMESKSIQQMGIPLYQSQMMSATPDLQLQLSNLGNIVTSQKVMLNAAQTLDDLGMKFKPEYILDATKVSSVRDTNILAIEVTLSDAREAQVAANVIAAEFKKVYADLNNASISQSREFIEAQIKTTREAMVQAQDALKRYKEKNGIVQIDQQLGTMVQKMAEARFMASQADITHQVAAARVRQADKEAASMPHWQESGKSIARNPIWEHLKVQLIDLETKRAAMLVGGPGQSKRLRNHPEVIALEAQIKDVQDRLLKTKDGIYEIKEDYLAARSESINPTYQNQYNNYISAKVDDVATAAQQAGANAVAEAMKSEMMELPSKEAKIAELTVDLKSATDTYGLMKSKLDEAKIREQQNRNEVALKTIDPAYVRLVDQKNGLKLLLALLLSPLMGVGVAFLLQYTDNTVKTAAEAEKLFGLPVLTAVPRSRAHSLPRQNCPEIMEVAYQMLTSNLWINSQSGASNSIVVVSAEPDAGRSVTASNLAVSLAREGARVILVDADLRKPTQHLIFGVDNKAGLTNILSGGATLEEALVPTRVQGLLLVSAGPIPDNPVKLLRSPEMRDFVAQVQDLADFVIYDTPAGITFPDPILVATMAGNAVVVHSAGRVPRGSEAEFRARMESIGIRLLGVVLNKVRREDSSGYFHFHRSYEGIGMPQLASRKKAIKGTGKSA